MALNSKTADVGKTLGMGQDIEVPIDQALLDQLWDFSDPELSEQRFRAAGDDPELHTQLARALVLQGRFEEAGQVLAAIRDDSPAARTRILLEGGRLANSLGDTATAIPQFEAAAKLAEESGLAFLAIDAVHMLAIADGARAAEHTRRGLDLVDQSEDDRTKRWAVSLHNNLGWHVFDDGDASSALVEFEAAFTASESVGTAEQRFYSRWAIARAYRELDRSSEALDLQEELVRERPEDEDVIDELRILRASAE